MLQLSKLASFSGIFQKSMSFSSLILAKRDNDEQQNDEPSSTLTLYHLSQILPFARIDGFC